jgi:hypothetical protein
MHQNNKADKCADFSNFHLNKEFISEMLEINPQEIQEVPNDWQDENKTIPELANHLHILTKQPGIFPIESIAAIDKERLMPFFSRLPQYSQINENCISPYFSPSEDKNLLRIAL